MDGWVSAVFERHVGSDLDADAAAGATSITVTDPDSFDYDGGELTIFEDPESPTANTDTAAYTMVFDDEGYPTGVLNLGSALVHAYTADQDTRVASTSAGAIQMERMATLQIEGQEEEIMARVDQSLRDRLPGGPRDPENMEQGQAEFDEYGELILKTLIALDPDVDGGYIDPATLPAPPPTPLTDGLSPTSSPTPVADGGVGFIGVSWPAITNADPVTYEVHLSATTGFTPSTATRCGEVQGLGFVITREADGDPLAPAVTYFVKIVAKDADGAASAGAQDSASIVTVPAPGATDGSPPGSSPTPTVTGGPNYIAAKWTPVANVDPVTYEVHISTTTGFTPSSGTKYGETAAGSMVIMQTATGAALLYGTTYYVKLVAKDGDGAASAGAQGSATMVKVAAADISVANLAAINADLGTLTAGVIDASVVTVSNLNATQITTGTLNASVVNISNLDASKIVSGSIATARLTANTLSALQANVSVLSAITADMGTLTAGVIEGGTYRTGPNVGTTQPGVILDSAGMRAYTSTPSVAATYELVASTGKVVVGSLASETSKQRIEIDRTGMALFEDPSAPITSPPSTGGGTSAALAWTTLYIAGVGATQTMITSIATGSANPLITCASAHGLTVGDTVRIAGHWLSTGALSPANGFWTVTALGTTSTFRCGLPSIASNYATPTGAVLGGSTAPNQLVPRGQFTTGTDLSKSRMWFDYQGLHSQAQFDGVNQNAPFRTFDFNPADATGLRLHSATTPNALIISPLNGVTFKLAATNNTADDLGARWVRQTGGAVAARFWGDNLGDDTRHGQANMYSYAVTASDVASCVVKAQVGQSTSPARWAQVVATANAAGTMSTVTARAVLAGGDFAVNIIRSDGNSDFVQGAVSGGVGIVVTTGANNPTVAIDTSIVPRLGAANTFTSGNTFSANATFNARAIINPSSDVASCDVRRGVDVSPTQPIFRVLNSSGGTIFFQVNKDGNIIFNPTTGIHFAGGTPQAPPNWTTNVYALRRNVPSSTTITPGQQADVVATLIDDLVAVGILS